jgi:tRNA (guanine6-N2)-methyltransferase
MMNVNKENRMAVNVFAITNRGLEPICAEEMKRVPALSVTGTSYRRVSAILRGNISAVLSLKTVDDVFIEVGGWEEIGPHRIVLQSITENSQKLVLEPALEVIAQARAVSRQPAYSVTANFVGKRNYSMDEIKAAAALGINGRYGWRYVDEDESEINIRIFIEHDTAYIGVRLAAVSLHRRAYKQAHLPGSLKPSVAAAMLLTAEAAPGMRMLDPLCGAGTLPIEAALQGVLAWGGDLDSSALDSARTNIRAAGISVHLQCWDAMHLPLASAIDGPHCNKPAMGAAGSGGRKSGTILPPGVCRVSACAGARRADRAAHQPAGTCRFRGHDPPGGDRDQPVWSESNDLKVQRLKAGKI